MTLLLPLVPCRRCCFLEKQAFPTKTLYILFSDNNFGLWLLQLLTKVVVTHK